MSKVVLQNTHNIQATDGIENIEERQKYTFFWDMTLHHCVIGFPCFEATQWSHLPKVHMSSPRSMDTSSYKSTRTETACCELTLDAADYIYTADSVTRIM